MTLLAPGARRRLRYTMQPLSLIVDGVAEERHYGFPGFAVLPNGDWCAVCRRGTGHNPIAATPASYGKIVAFRSTNQGQTWTAPAVIQEDLTLDLRDPTLAVLSDGRLAMIYFDYEVTLPSSLDVWVTYSSDGGVTWTQREALPFFTDRWAAVSGPIVEPTPGHLLAVAYTSVPELRWVESADNGQTWTPGSALTGFAPGTQEPYAQVRPDGLVEVHLRGVYTNSTTPTLRHRTIRRADGTWTTPEVFAPAWASGRPAWAVNPTTGHRFASDRYGNHSWTIAPTVDDMRTDPNDWAWFGPEGSQYEQPVAYGRGFIAALAMRPAGEGEFSSLYWTRWDPTT